jgi:Phage integrase, N-terminal SAM-like domain
MNDFKQNKTKASTRSDQMYSRRSKGLLEVTREKIRLRHLSLFTEKHYLAWVRQFIRFHQRRHPREMAEKEIEQFLSYLAVKRGVAPSTQNQALNALGSYTRGSLYHS